MSFNTGAKIKFPKRSNNETQTILEHITATIPVPRISPKDSDSGTPNLSLFLSNANLVIACDI